MNNSTAKALAECVLKHAEKFASKAPWKNIRQYLTIDCIAEDLLDYGIDNEFEAIRYFSKIEWFVPE